jgi:hypothetical protein
MGGESGEQHPPNRSCERNYPEPDHVAVAFDTLS